MLYNEISKTPSLNTLNKSVQAWGFLVYVKYFGLTRQAILDKGRVFNYINANV